jgi:hypothetical protein
MSIDSSTSVCCVWVMSLATWVMSQQYISMCMPLSLCVCLSIPTHAPIPLHIHPTHAHTSIVHLHYTHTYHTTHTSIFPHMRIHLSYIYTTDVWEMFVCSMIDVCVHLCMIRLSTLHIHLSHCTCTYPTTHTSHTCAYIYRTSTLHIHLSYHTYIYPTTHAHTSIIHLHYTYIYRTSIILHTHLSHYTHTYLLRDVIGTTVYNTCVVYNSR